MWYQRMTMASISASIRHRTDRRWAAAAVGGDWSPRDGSGPAGDGQRRLSAHCVRTGRGDGRRGGSGARVVGQELLGRARLDEPEELVIGTDRLHGAGFIILRHELEAAAGEEVDRRRAVARLVVAMRKQRTTLYSGLLGARASCSTPWPGTGLRSA